MKSIFNLVYILVICIGSIYLYDRFFLEPIYNFDGITVSEANGEPYIELGNFIADGVNKSGIQIKDEKGKIRAFYGVVNGEQYTESSPLFVMYNASEKPVLSIQNYEDNVWLSVGERNAEKSVLVTSDNEGAYITVRGHDRNGMMNEIGMIAASEPGILLLNQHNALSLHAKKEQKSIIIVRDGERAWTSSY